MQTFQVGSVFAGDYRIVRRLGAGGMGAVYVVEQVSTGKQRALKVMLPSLVDSPAQRKRFEQEAHIGALIDSHHVVEVIAAGIEASSQTPWLAMELLQGETLEELVTKTGPCRNSTVREIFSQLSHALIQAHSKGIVHRDLKPENVFIARSELYGHAATVKILDFGIAKLTLEGGGKTTDAMGSPLWMAPEQTERAGVDARADVWALGLIAYYLLTGKSFWNTGNSADGSIPQLLREILFEPIPSAEARAHEQGAVLPPGFNDWFAHCVTRDRTVRFPSAKETWAAMKTWLDQEHTVVVGAQARASSRPGPDPLEATLAAPPIASLSSQPQVSRLWLALAAAPIFVIGAIVLGGKSLFAHSEPAPTVAVPSATASAATLSIDASAPIAVAELSPVIDAGIEASAPTILVKPAAVAAPRKAAEAMVRIHTEDGLPAVKNVILSSAAGLSACYRKSSANEGKGYADITLDYDATGVPSRVNLVGAIPPDDTLAPCFKSVLMGLRFPPDGARTVHCTAYLYPAGIF